MPHSILAATDLVIPQYHDSMPGVSDDLSDYRETAVLTNTPNLARRRSMLAVARTVIRPSPMARPPMWFYVLYLVGRTFRQHWPIRDAPLESVTLVAAGHAATDGLDAAPDLLGAILTRYGWIANMTDGAWVTALVRIFLAPSGLTAGMGGR